MSVEVHISHTISGFHLDAGFEATAGVTAIFGRSGAGKTTLINAVAGLLRPDAGHVRIDGDILFDGTTCVPPHKRRMGYVFQDARLFPHMTVRQNLEYGARHAARVTQSSQYDPSLQDVAELLGLTDLFTRPPLDLSGGEKQRVALGRALLSRPRMLLMDEPLAALDAARKDSILPYLEQLKSGAAGLPILYVSHALDEVARLADHLVVLADGKVAASGPLFDVLSDPSVVPLLGVRQAGAVIVATVVAHAHNGISTLQLSAGQIDLPGVQAPVGTRVRLRVLAQDVILSRTRPDGLSSANILPVTVRSIRTGIGPGAALALDAGPDRLLARIPADAIAKLDLSEGVDCFAVINATSVAPLSIGR
jgi:molybdate transport system ATP-binding protein